jgi:hypothetical protein
MIQTKISIYQKGGFFCREDGKAESFFKKDGRDYSLNNCFAGKAGRRDIFLRKTGGIIFLIMDSCREDREKGRENNNSNYRLPVFLAILLFCREGGGTEIKIII